MYQEPAQGRRSPWSEFLKIKTPNLFLGWDGGGGGEIDDGTTPFTVLRYRLASCNSKVSSSWFTLQISLSASFPLKGLQSCSLWTSFSFVSVLDHTEIVDFTRPFIFIKSVSSTNPQDQMDVTKATCNTRGTMTFP